MLRLERTLQRLAVTVDEEQLANLDESLPRSQRWIRRRLDDYYFSTDNENVQMQRYAARGAAWFTQVVIAQAMLREPG